MSKKRKRWKATTLATLQTVKYDPGFRDARLAASQVADMEAARNRSGVKHLLIQVDTADFAPKSVEEAVHRQRMAMLMAKKARAETPWCDVCNVHLVQRVGTGKTDPFDRFCGICSRVSVEYGLGRASDEDRMLERHTQHCVTCQRNVPWCTNCSRERCKKIDECKGRPIYDSYCGGCRYEYEKAARAEADREDEDEGEEE